MGSRNFTADTDTADNFLLSARILQYSIVIIIQYRYSIVIILSGATGENICRILLVYLDYYFSQGIVWKTPSFLLR